MRYFVVEVELRPSNSMYISIKGEIGIKAEVLTALLWYHVPYLEHIVVSKKNLVFGQRIGIAWIDIDNYSGALVFTIREYNFLRFGDHVLGI